MPLLPVFIESRFHELNTLAVAFHSQLRAEGVAFEWHADGANRANNPQMYAAHIVRHLSSVNNTEENFKNAKYCLSDYEDASLWSTEGWKIRKKLNGLVDLYADSLKKDINGRIKTEERSQLDGYDFSVKKSSLEYLRARYFASWWKKWLLSLLTAGFFILFLLGLSVLANIGLLGFLGVFIVKSLMTLNTLFASSFFILQGVPVIIAFTVIFGILALLTFRELVDPGFYIKCFGRKNAIEFHHSIDRTDRVELEEEYCAKQYQYDDEFTVAIKILLNPRLLPEWILKGIEFLLCRFVDFVDSFFMKSNSDRSTVGARAIKWFIHIVFCLLTTPLQLLRPIEDFPYWALKIICLGLGKIWELISVCFSRKYPEERRRGQGPWSLERHFALSEQTDKAFAAKMRLEYKQPVVKPDKRNYQEVSNKYKKTAAV